jgi:FtsZ-interacting cell division protein ZipA
METWEWIVIAAVIVAAIVVVAALWGSSRRRRAHLRDRFGPEYDRAVSDSGRRDAERRLAAVESEHERLEIKPLSEAARERYLEEWRNVEARFVNDPEDATKAAERVVLRALEERGYPTGRDAEERAAHLAVDHSEVVERYRHGRAMLGEVNGAEGTENLRKAMLDFRAVFEEVVERERTAA